MLSGKTFLLSLINQLKQNGFIIVGKNSFKKSRLNLL